ncbi:MAG: hypothetical protein IKT23_08765 [Clostridia bacterium]|nr:hypothetical protein [Clostridia bacterium]
MNNSNSKRINRWLLLVMDVLLLLGSLYFAKLMRGGLVMSFNKRTARIVWLYAPLFIANHTFWLWLMGAYRVMWMYAELKDMAKLAFACVLAACINLAMNAVFDIGYSRYVLGFLAVFGLVLVITSRYLLFLARNVMSGRKSDKQVKRALIIGADTEGIRLAKELPLLDDGGRHVAAAFLDEDVDKLYRRIGSLPVEGMYLDAAKVIKSRHIDEVVTSRKIASSPAFKSVYLEAAKADCEVKIYGDGALDKVTLSDAVSSGSGGINDTEALKTRPVAVIGGGELALGIARALTANNVDVRVLDGSEKELKALKRVGAKIALGSVFSKEDVSGFIKANRPGSVVYLAGVRDAELAEGNEGAAETANVAAPISALEAAKLAGAETFVRVTDILDLPEEAELLKTGENALLDVQADGISVCCVSVRGLLCEGGLLDRLEKDAQAGCLASDSAQGCMAFISVPQAAAAIINLLCAKLTGALEIKGSQPVNMAEVLRALGGNPSEDQQAPEAAGEASEPTAVSDVYVRAR